MSTSTSYCTAGEFTKWAMNDQSAQVAESGIIDVVIDAASREVEEYCNRQFPGFNADTQTSSRVYAVENPFACWVDDIADTSNVTVAVDLAGDGTFEQVWSSTDFQIEPVNANAKGRPGNLIRSRGIRWFPIGSNSGYVRINGLNTTAYVGAAQGLASVMTGVAAVQVTAKWGWPSVPVNVKQATIIQAHHLYSSKGTPLGVLQTPDLGAARVTSYLHPTAARLLRGFRKGDEKLV